MSSLLPEQLLAHSQQDDLNSLDSDDKKTEASQDMLWQ